jgi:beta-galactosidase
MDYKKPRIYTSHPLAMLRSFSFLSILGLLCCAEVAANPEQIALDDGQARNVTRLNFDWSYRPGEVTDRDHQPVVEYDRWQTVQLPHDPSIYGPFTRQSSSAANGWRPQGCGIYQKVFNLPTGARGKLVLLEFEGIYRDAQVWINGQHLIRHLNGYLGFEVDLTPHIKFDEPNVLIVSYDNRQQNTSRWFTGEGIYRDVWLRIVDPLHIPLHGTYIVTPQITLHAANVVVETEIVNQHDQRTLCQLVTELCDPDDKVVASATAVAPIVSGQTHTFRQQLNVPGPRLWELDQPHLYTAVSKVYRNKELVDEYTTRFGIRLIEMTPDRGLLLNGKKIVAKGGNLHHDLGCMGAAALKAGYQRIIDELKAIGCNSMRLAHNPHAPVLLDVCDERGILVVNEAYDKWTSQFYGGEVSFESQWQQDITAFIRRDRNHPCVYIWSMGNEVLKQQKKHEEKFEPPEAAADFGAGLMKRMANFTRKLEPSRLVTCGLFPARAEFTCEWNHWEDYETYTSALPPEMAFEMDVVSWNYTENMFAQDHKDYPQFMFIASESSTNLDFGHRIPSWLELDFDYVIGHYYWSGYDYLGESIWPKKSWGRAFIDLSGWVTPIGRYYQSFYSEQPMVHIMVHETDPALLEAFNKLKNKRWDWYPMADHWNWPGREEAALTTFTNCDSVELLLNGQSLGVKQLSDGEHSRIDWEVDYVPGKLTAVARNGNEVVSRHELVTAGKAAAIGLTPHKPALKADGLDLVYIEAALVDHVGNLVPEYGREIAFSLSGPASNAGVANGHVISDEPWQAEQRMTLYGRVRLIVRSTRETGPVDIRASCDGLPDVILRIPSQ